MFDNGKTESDDNDDYVTEKFVIPDYQRIEESGGLEIVDGVQRLSTLYSFVQGNLRLKKVEKLAKLKDFYFYDLTEASQKKV